jgi:sec-independent protein translocase protein TatC
MSDEELLPLLFKNLDELRYRVIRIFYVFGSVFIFLMIFRIQTLDLFGFKFPFIYPNVYRNMGSQFLALVESHVLPKGTEILVFRPTDGVAADLYLTMFMALVLSMPYTVYQISRFLNPALKKSERDMVKSLVIPASGLFAAGSFVGLWLIAPELFIIFNRFDLGLGASTTMGLMNFVSFLFIYVLTFGLAFELPVIMVAITRLGIVNSDYWRKNWRYAVVASLIFGMIFSPGVTGFTMIVMSVPMMILYFGGYYFARRIERRRMDQAKQENKELFSN